MGREFLQQEIIPRRRILEADHLLDVLQAWDESLLSIQVRIVTHGYDPPR